MANKHRGEVDITIAGKTYPVAMTLEALALIADAIKVESLGEIDARMTAFKISDMKPMLAAMLAGNGHEVAEKALDRLSFREYVAFMAAIWNAGRAKEDDAEASPLKRAS